MNKYKFIERITHHQKPDKHNTNVTLVAYPLYFTNMEFLELLMLRYRVPPPKDKTQAAIRKISAEFQTPIRLRVANTLKAWVTTYPYRFYKDALLRNTLLEFLRNDVKEGIPQLALSIEQELLNRTAAGEGGTPRAPDELVEPLLPPENLNFETAKFTDFDPVEVKKFPP
jgi:son of sevenless-like protein